MIDEGRRTREEGRGKKEERRRTRNIQSFGVAQDKYRTRNVEL